MTQPILVIMAAGLGSRYQGLKQLDGIGPHNETLMDYSIYDAIKAGFKKVILVIRKDFAEQCQNITNARWGKRVHIQYAYQDLQDLPIKPDNPERSKPWGTGHALLAARDLIDAPFAILNADDFYGRSAFEQIYQYLAAQPKPPEAAMIGYQLKHTLSAHGAVTRGICHTDQGWVSKVEERRGICQKDNGIEYLHDNEQPGQFTGDEWASMNFWGFSQFIIPTIQELFIQFLKTQGTQQKSEFLIPDAVNELLKTQSLKLKLLPSTSPWFGMTYQEDRARVTGEIQSLIAEGLYPAKL